MDVPVLLEHFKAEMAQLKGDLMASLEALSREVRELAKRPARQVEVDVDLSWIEAKLAQILNRAPQIPNPSLPVHNSPETSDSGPLYIPGDLLSTPMEGTVPVASTESSDPDVNNAAAVLKKARKGKNV